MIPIPWKLSMSLNLKDLNSIAKLAVNGSKAAISLFSVSIYVYIFSKDTKPKLFKFKDLQIGAVESEFHPYK